MSYVDKRDHYRIDDDIQVTWKVVRQSAVQDTNAVAYFETSASFPLLRDLYQLDLEASDMLRVINEGNRQLGAFLHNLSHRIELLSRAVLVNDIGEDPAAQAARLSIGGISFVTDELLSPGTTLALKLVFRSRVFGFTCFGEVRHSRLIEARDGYIVGVRFLDLEEGIRNLIQRHILHRQAEERRERLRRDAGI